MNTRIELFSQNITEWPRMEKHFETMALKGWLITKIWGGFAIYKTIEPAQLTFCVAVYPEAKAFERFDKNKSAAYIQQEQENGWKLAASKHNLQVFYRLKNVEGPKLRRSFQVGNIHSHIQLETFSLGMLLTLNAFTAYKIFPPSHHMFYRNLSLTLIAWMPLIILFFAARLLANAMFIYREGKGLTLENYHEYPAGFNRFLNAAAYFLAGGVMVFLVMVVAIDYVESGRQLLIGMLPLLLAMGVGLSLRKYLSGKNWDGVQKTLVVLSLVVAVVFGTSHVTRNHMMGSQEQELPQGRVALTVEDLTPGGVPSYQSYRSSGSLLVPEYYRYYESLAGEMAVNTEVANVRSEKMAEYLYQLHRQEMVRFNYQFSPATDHFPGYDEALYAIQAFRPKDGTQGGTLLVRDGLHVISLSISRDLNDQQVQDLLAGKIEEIMAN